MMEFVAVVEINKYTQFLQINEEIFMPKPFLINIKLKCHKSLIQGYKMLPYLCWFFRRKSQVWALNPNHALKSSQWGTEVRMAII